MPHLPAVSLARVLSRAAIATTSTSFTARAGRNSADGVMRAAPSTPNRSRVMPANLRAPPTPADPPRPRHLSPRADHEAVVMIAPIMDVQPHDRGCVHSGFVDTPIQILADAGRFDWISTCVRD